MTHSELLAALVAICPILYAAVFVHEIGHAVVGRQVGFIVTSFGMGIARPWWVVRIAGMRIYFARTRPLQGFAWAFMPQFFPSRGQLVGFAAGGVLANGLVALIALALWYGLPGGGVIWITTAAINGLFVGINLVPLRARIGKVPFRSDGALILQALRAETFAPPPPMVIQAARGLRGLWAAIGDDLMLRIHMVSAAEAWAGLGEYDRAEALLMEADALPGSVPSAIRPIAAIVGAGIAMGRGRFEDADRALSEAETCFRSSEHAMGLLTVAITRAHSQLLRGDSTGAAVELDRLAPTVRAAGRSALSAALLLPRLAAAVALSDRKALSDRLAEYASSRRSQHSAARDLYVYRTLAGFHAANEDWGAAEPAYRQALAAAAELTAAWLDAEEQTRFRERYAPLVEEARQCLRGLGKDEEAEQLAARLNPEPAKALPDRDRRLRGIGLRIMFLNTFGMAGAAALAEIGGSIAGRPFTALATILAVFTVIGVVFLVFDRTVGRPIPYLRSSGGAVLLLLACLPWPLIIGLVAIYLTFAPS